MFNKLKQFKDLRDQAKELQSKLSEETVTLDKQGVSLTMDGNLALKEINIDPSKLEPANKAKLESAIVELHGDALKKVQRMMAAKMKEMGGLPNIPGMS